HAAAAMEWRQRKARGRELDHDGRRSAASLRLAGRGEREQVDGVRASEMASLEQHCTAPQTKERERRVVRLVDARDAKTREHLGLGCVHGGERRAREDTIAQVDDGALLQEARAPAG